MQHARQAEDACRRCEDTVLLHVASLQAAPGKLTVVTGPNGGGKTTLIKCILGLLAPMQGEILYNGSRQRPVIGYLPQYTSIDRRFPITVGEVILSGLASRKPLAARYTADDRQQAARVAARMGLQGLENRPIGSLSGGQLQRALLGRAVAAQPRLLLLDEPSTYLDRHYETRLYQLLEELNHECAIILVSHDIGTILQQVKAIACVNGILDYHPDTLVSEEWIERNFQCPIDLLGHGPLPHRILGHHHHHSENPQTDNRQ